jgi:hypothetical protein
VWEYRYYAIENNNRVHKTLTFDGALYKTEKALRHHLESFVLKLNDKTEYARASDVTFGALLDRYIAEEMPTRHSTRSGYTSIIKITFARNGLRESSRKSRLQNCTAGCMNSIWHPSRKGTAAL